MPLKDTNVPKSIAFTREVAAEIQRLADESHRSFSSQVAFMIDEYLKIKSK